MTRHAETDHASTRWMANGNCAGVDPDLFFPPRGGNTAEARQVCAACTVRAECLEYALVNKERFGIWGGKSERERRKLRQARAAAELARPGAA